MEHRDVRVLRTGAVARLEDQHAVGQLRRRVDDAAADAQVVEELRLVLVRDEEPVGDDLGAVLRKAVAVEAVVGRSARGLLGG